MKRLIKKATFSDALSMYKSVINNLMANDHNGTWNEIYDDYKDEYDEQEALQYSIEEAKESLEIAMEDIDRDGDAELFNFYSDQLNTLNSIVL